MTNEHGCFNKIVTCIILKILNSNFFYLVCIRTVYTSIIYHLIFIFLLFYPNSHQLTLIYILNFCFKL